MEHKPELIVMLTRNDHTAENAYEIFDQCRDSKARFWGFKERPLPIGQMKELYTHMKARGKTTFLEVVAYTEEECVAGAETAAACGCDYLLGTLFFDSVNRLCREKGLNYMPFVGRVTGRPSVLEGTPEDMIAQARSCLEKGIHGFDLLGYRYTGNAAALNRQFVSQVDAPVCLAGSINSWQRLGEVLSVNPWAFTIGSAFFEHRFSGTFREQIDKVCDYIRR